MWTRRHTRNTHDGHEFNYILEGSMTLFIGEEIRYLVNKGDAIYFDSRNTPTPCRRKTAKRCCFLAIIAK